MISISFALLAPDQLRHTRLSTGSLPLLDEFPVATLRSLGSVIVSRPVEFAGGRIGNNVVIVSRDEIPRSAPSVNRPDRTTSAFSRSVAQRPLQPFAVPAGGERPPDSGENSGWLRWMGGRLPTTLQGPAMCLRHQPHTLHRTKRKDRPECLPECHGAKACIREIFRIGTCRRGYVKPRDAGRILRDSDLSLAVSKCSELKALVNTIISVCGGAVVP